MRFSSILMVSTAVILAACSSAEKQTLEGERITVNFKKTAIVPNPAALEVSVHLPRPEAVASWGQAGGNAAHNLSHAGLDSVVAKSWKESLGGGNTTERQIFSTPVYENGAIFAANAKGEVYAISEEFGKELWEVKFEGEDGENLDYAPALAVQNGILYMTLSSGDVVALNAENGQEIWRVALGIPVRSAPSVDDEHVYVIAHNNSFYALDVKTGALKWTHNGIEEQLAILGGPSAAISDKGIVIVPYSSGEIYALSQKDGRYLWHDALSINVGSDLYSSLVDVEASPVIADDVVYAVNHNGQLSAFDLQTGRRFWSVSLSATQMPWVAGTVIYIVTENDELVCINRRDGLVRWVQPLNPLTGDEDVNETAYWAGPVLAGDRLITVSSAGYALAIDPFDGSLKSVMELSDPVSVAPIVADERLVLFSEKGRLITFK